MNENEIQQNWEKRGYSFGVGNIKVSDAVDNAIHEDLEEIIIMVNGKLEVTIGEESFIPDVGQEFIIPAKSTHSLKNIGDVDSKIYFGYKSTDS